MMVPDVDRFGVERLAQRREDLRVPVPEVEDAAVAVAVHEATAVERIPEVRAFTSTEHDVDPERLERLHLAARDVLGERFQRRLTRVERLHAARAYRCASPAAACVGP